jgi:hypothetical protein
LKFESLSKSFKIFVCRRVFWNVQSMQFVHRSKF